MGNNTPARRPLIAAPMSPPPAPKPTTLRRSQSPDEAMADLWVGVARTHALQGVTAYAIESLMVLGRKHRELVEELPEMENLANLLIVNAARLMTATQAALLNDHVDVVITP